MSLTDADRAEIERSVAGLGVERWRPLDSTERDLVRRALAPAPSAQTEKEIA